MNSGNQTQINKTKPTRKEKNTRKFLDSQLPNAIENGCTIPRLLTNFVFRLSLEATYSSWSSRSWVSAVVMRLPDARSYSPMLGIPWHVCALLPSHQQHCGARVASVSCPFCRMHKEYVSAWKP